MPEWQGSAMLRAVIYVRRSFESSENGPIRMLGYFVRDQEYSLDVDNKTWVEFRIDLTRMISPRITNDSCPLYPIVKAGMHVAVYPQVN